MHSNLNIVIIIFNGHLHIKLSVIVIYFYLESEFDLQKAIKQRNDLTKEVNKLSKLL